jgi:hypothetical protein
MRVEIVITDDQGRRWKVYDWSLISGHKYRRAPGEQCAEYRGFLDELTGERRVYRFPSESAPRLCSAVLLSRQLAEAKVLAEQPIGPQRRAVGLQQARAGALPPFARRSVR